MENKYFDRCGFFIGKFPKPCISDCSASGAVDESVAFWTKKLKFDIDFPRAQAIDWLEGFGSWEKEELEACSDTQLAHKVLWLGCCDIKENGEWFGLVN